jgi:hypothetical protein
MTSILSHVGFFTCSAYFTVSELEALDSTVTKKINAHVEEHEGLYDPEELMALLPVWTMRQWKEVVKRSEGLIWIEIGGHKVDC